MVQGSSGEQASGEYRSKSRKNTAYNQRVANELVIDFYMLYNV